MADSTIFLIIAVVGSILVSMTLHEAMHAFASNWLGDDTARLEGRLTLNPIRHIDPFLTVLLPLSLILLNINSVSARNLPIVGAAKPVPFNPARVKYDEFGAAMVGLAGPLTNLVLALVTAVFIRFSFNAGGGEILLSLLFIFLQVNVGFFVFNMIPFPPLDGSRLLYAVAPEPVKNVMYQIEGMGLAGLFIFLFLFFPLISPLIRTVNITILNLLLGA